MIEKLDHIRVLCEHGKENAQSTGVRDLFVRISTNSDIVETLIETHFEVYHSPEESVIE